MICWANVHFTVIIIELRANKKLRQCYNVIVPFDSLETQQQVDHTFSPYNSYFSLTIFRIVIRMRVRIRIENWIGKLRKYAFLLRNRIACSHAKPFTNIVYLQFSKIVSHHQCYTPTIDARTRFHCGGVHKNPVWV